MFRDISGPAVLTAVQSSATAGDTQIAGGENYQGRRWRFQSLSLPLSIVYARYIRSPDMANSWVPGVTGTKPRNMNVRTSEPANKTVSHLVDYFMVQQCTKMCCHCQQNVNYYYYYYYGAWMRQVMDVRLCLSVCPVYALSFESINFIFGTQVHLRNIYIKFAYQVHQANVIGAKRSYKNN